jgi:hypothetical protein
VSEFFPIASGLVLGVLLNLLRPSMRLWVAAVLAIVFGFLATVVSGEYELTWAFLLIDIPLVVFATAIGFMGMRYLRSSLRQQ